MEGYCGKKPGLLRLVTCFDWRKEVKGDLDSTGASPIAII